MNREELETIARNCGGRIVYPSYGTASPVARFRSQRQALQFRAALIAAKVRSVLNPGTLEVLVFGVNQ